MRERVCAIVLPSESNRERERERLLGQAIAKPWRAQRERETKREREREREHSQEDVLYQERALCCGQTNNITKRWKSLSLSLSLCTTGLNALLQAMCRVARCA